MNRRGGEFAIVSETGRELERFPVIYGAHIQVKDGEQVKAGDLLATWDPFTTPIITEVDGTVKFGDIMPVKPCRKKLIRSPENRVERSSNPKVLRSVRGFQSRIKDGKTANCRDHLAWHAIFCR